MSEDFKAINEPIVERLRGDITRETRAGADAIDGLKKAKDLEEVSQFYEGSKSMLGVDAAKIEELKQRHLDAISAKRREDPWAEYEGLSSGTTLPDDDSGINLNSEDSGINLSKGLGDSDASIGDDRGVDIDGDDSGQSIVETQPQASKNINTDKGGKSR